MEGVKGNKSIITSYRLSQDTNDKLQQQLKDLCMTHEQYFSKVVKFMESENVKQNKTQNEEKKLGVLEIKEDPNNKLNMGFL